jgi:hypothetical protein
MILTVYLNTISPAKFTLKLRGTSGNMIEFLKVFKIFRHDSTINYFYEILDNLVLWVLTFDELPIVDLVA